MSLFECEMKDHCFCIFTSISNKTFGSSEFKCGFIRGLLGAGGGLCSFEKHSSYTGFVCSDLTISAMRQARV